MPSLPTLLVLIACCLTFAQKPTPCPNVFQYVSHNWEDRNRWSGVINLRSDEDLLGVYVKLTLDRRAELLGNTFGATASSDNREFTITSTDYLLRAGETVPLHLYVQYNPADTIPSLVSVRLNDRLICGGGETQRPTSRPSNTARPAQQKPSNQNRPKPAQNGGNQNVQSRPSTVNQNRPASRPQYENNDYEVEVNRPVSSGSPLNVDSNSYPSNQNEYSPAFGSVTENRPSNNGYRPSQSTNNNYNTNGNNNLNSGGSFSPTTEEVDYFPGDFSVPRPVTKPDARPPIAKQKPGCGTVSTRPTPLVTHGLNTTEGQYPWHAALYHSQGIQLTYICGGSLISENYVVTAAHCVTNPSTGRPIQAQNVLVYLGKHNLKKFGTESQDLDVSKIIVHRDYNHTVFHNDIALLKLGRAADITDYVRPVCLWEGSQDLNALSGDYGTVVGWGFDETGRLSTSLMETKMPVVPTVTCIYSNPDFFSRFTFDKSYCAGFRNGTTVCNGDSGGGMVFPKVKRNGDVLSWHLRGLVSVGVALQGKTSCDPSHYIVFTDVAKHLDWIRNNTNHY